MTVQFIFEGHRTVFVENNIIRDSDVDLVRLRPKCIDINAKYCICAYCVLFTI